MDKKLAAAVTGVLYSMMSEEDQAVYPASSRTSEEPSPWALHGRQTIMQMRSLLQRRVLKR